MRELEIALGVAGLAMILAEWLNLNHKLEAALDAVRSAVRLILGRDVGLTLAKLYYVNIGGAAVYLAVNVVSPAAAAQVETVMIFVICTAMVLFAAFTFLCLMDAMPRGSVGGLGFVMAVVSLVLSFLS